MDIRDFYKKKDIEETNEDVDKDKSPQNKKRKMHFQLKSAQFETCIPKNTLRSGERRELTCNKPYNQQARRRCHSQR